MPFPSKKPVSPLATTDSVAYGEAARRALIGVIKKSGGVSIDDAADITGENCANSVRMEPGMFSHGGQGIDLVARRLHEAGYLTDEEYDSADGGTQRARDLINDALRKQPVMPQEQQERMAELESREADAAAELMGQAEQAMLNEINGEALTDAELFALHGGIPWDTAADQVSVDNQKEQDNADRQSAAVESQAGDVQPGSAEANPQSGPSHPGRAGVQASDTEQEAGRPELNLTQQTERELADREAEIARERGRYPFIRGRI